MTSQLSDVILGKIQNYLVSEPEVPSLKRFAEQNKDFFIEHSTSADLRRFWNRAFKKALEGTETTFENNEPDWNEFTQLKLENMLKEVAMNKTKKRSSKSSMSSSVTAAQSAKNTLTDEQWKLFEDSYHAMNDEKKWKLEDGTVVEDTIYKYAKTCSTEQAAHSFILDLEDEWVKDYFTVEQVKAMKRHHCSPLPSINECATKFFKHIEDKNDFEDLCKAVKQAGPYDEKTESDADWAQMSLRDLLRAYRYGIVKRIADRNSEKDIILRIWRMIDVVFDDIDVETSRGDKASVAMSSRLNRKRRISEAGLAPKLAAWKPDLLLTKDEVEYGCSENGGKEEAGAGEKETVEKWLKLPKLLKDMLSLAAEKLGWEEGSIRHLKILGFIHTHLRISLLILDCPDGYVSRISRTGEYEVPLQKERIANQILPIMKLILKAKQIVKDNVAIVDRGPQNTNEDPDLLAFESNEAKLLLPYALNPPTTACKKSKINHE